MKLFITLLTTLLLTVLVNAQKIYNPEANAKADIEQALAKAKKENKNVILQVGGNWCGWCILFNKYINSDEEIKSIKDNNFVYYHLNYSKENKNEELLKKYNNPEKHGFPVLLVLDQEGNLIHTQETGSLEEGKGYKKELVLAFFRAWSTK